MPRRESTTPVQSSNGQNGWSIRQGTRPPYISTSIGRGPVGDPSEVLHKLVSLAASDGLEIDPASAEPVNDEVKIYTPIELHDERSIQWRRNLANWLCQSLGQVDGPPALLTDFPEGYKLWHEATLKVSTGFCFCERMDS
jgi:hypothetical protein